MPATGNKIFISYSHKDAKWKDEVVKFLKAYGEAPEDQFDVWVDRRIKPGDDWLDEIEQAMKQARVALLLLSSDFLTSEFIRKEELSKLMARRQAEGLRVIPIALKPCPWESWPSLNTKQVWPSPDRPLSAMKVPQREEELSSLARQVATLLKGPAGATPAARPGPEPASVESRVEALFEQTLCSTLDDAHRSRAARNLVAFLREHTRLDGEDLFRAGRYLVEHRLLNSEDSPHCAVPDDDKTPFADGQEDLQAALKEHVRPPRKTPPFVAPRIETTPGAFLQRTAERAQDWYDYFMALETPAIAGFAGKDVHTLCLIEIGGGALASQYLLAGLMSHFHDEWKPVISGYTYPTRSSDGGAGMLERLKASQWICWLVWGPSIPLCTCPHWQPLSAYQFGYGDENNSLPAYALRDPDGLRASLREQALGGKYAIELDSLVARLTWGPSVFPDRPSFARAQARLTSEADDEAEDRANEQPNNGLLLDIQETTCRDAQANEPAYFTAYIWLMFWISRAPAAGEAAPLRLNGRPLPDAVNDVNANRERVRKERLWEDLLPVFVHANILDPVVLKFQKSVLVENAVHLLKSIWKDNQGIQFHLVCASDYTGCGCPVAFPSQPAQAFLELMRARLKTLPKEDQAFASAVRLPEADEPAAARAPAFRAFLSACHLPEMIDGYYQSLGELMKRLHKAGK